MMAQPMIRIVHLSDLHVGVDIATYQALALSGTSGVEVDSLAMLADAASRASVERLPPNASAYCVVSGDLSAHGLEGELRDAITFLQRSLVIAVNGPDVGLDFSRDGCSVIPGNHDIWGSEHPFCAWVTRGVRHASPRPLLQVEAPSNWSRSTGGHLDLGPIRVRAYLLDSTQPGLRNMLARGRVDGRQLDRLEAIVKRDEGSDRDKTHACLRIAVLHHPVVSVEHHRFTMVLENAEALTARLRKLNFGMVLAGHEHVCDIRELVPAGSGLWQCVSGAAAQITQDRGQNSFYIYELERTADGCRVRARRFSRAGIQRAPFQEEPSPKEFSPLLATM